MQSSQPTQQRGQDQQREENVAWHRGLNLSGAACVAQQKLDSSLSTVSLLHRLCGIDSRWFSATAVMHLLQEPHHVPFRRKVSQWTFLAPRTALVPHPGP